MASRLHPQTLARLPRDVRRPAYERLHHGVGIVHLGVGAFHRAHQAVYVDDALARFGGDWRILGVSLRSAGVRDQLEPQEGLFMLDQRGRERRELRVIGSIAAALVAPEDPQLVIDALANPDVHIVSLTITEKGYCRDAASGRLNFSHPDIVHDLANPHAPRSALGYLAEGLRLRAERSLAAPTLLCCDNLPHNGATLRSVLLELAQQRSPALAAWIEENVACPATMVDRVVPATTPADLDEVAALVGVRDEGLVKAEPFTQWVIEDRFAGPHPQFAEVGATLVPDVRPFEIAKLRLLNGSHSTLAYLGSLAGLTYVHEAIVDPDLRPIIDHLMCNELSPTLTPVAGLDLCAYRAALLERFANPALAHRLLQIAMDGSQKLPQRLLAAASTRLREQCPIDAIALAVAGWMRFAVGEDEQGRRRHVDDPLSPRLAAIAQRCGRDPAGLVESFLGITEMFPRELAEHPVFRGEVLRHLSSLYVRGARATLHDFADKLKDR